MNFFENYAIVAMESDNVTFYACKIIKVTSGFNLKQTNFFARWRQHPQNSWNHDILYKSSLQRVTWIYMSWSIKERSHWNVNFATSCNHSFLQKDALKIHLASAHEGIRPLKCELCEHSFSSKGFYSFKEAGINNAERKILLH